MREFLLIFITFVISVNSNEELLSRHKRLIPPPPPFLPPLLFAQNAATGVLVAIAVPVPLPDQNVFVSYNFEANYNMPSFPNDSFPGPLKRLKLTNKYPATELDSDATPDDIIARKIEGDDEIVESAEQTTIGTEISIKVVKKTHKKKKNLEERTKRSLLDKIVFTRSSIYHLIESRLNADGVNGKKCLLHAICESSKIPLIDINGVLGHVIHIILTPSTSASESSLPSEYYKAEKLGLKGNCKKYENACNLNLLSLFSTII